MSISGIHAPATAVLTLGALALSACGTLGAPSETQRAFGSFEDHINKNDPRVVAALEEHIAGLYALRYIEEYRIEHAKKYGTDMGFARAQERMGDIIQRQSYDFARSAYQRGQIDLSELSERAASAAVGAVGAYIGGFLEGRGRATDAELRNIRNDMRAREEALIDVFQDILIGTLVNRNADFSSLAGELEAEITANGFESVAQTANDALRASNGNPLEMTDRDIAALYIVNATLKAQQAQSVSQEKSEEAAPLNLSDSHVAALEAQGVPVFRTGDLAAGVEAGKGTAREGRG